jgi:endonuclease III
VPKETKTKLVARAAAIADILVDEYPEATTALEHTTAFELLIETILAAQCTDARVNQISPALFKRWPDATAMAKASQAEMEKYVKSCGFYRNKAKNLIAASKQLVANHGGEVPSTMDELTALPGVARKTANVVLGTFFERPAGIAIDTHCQRVSRRLGLTRHDDPVKIERDLTAILPRERWTHFGHGLIFHGRRVCVARKPRCAPCRLHDLCPSRQDVPNPRPLPGKYDEPPKRGKRAE